MSSLDEMSNGQTQSANLINDLRSAISGGTAGLIDVPLLVARVIETEIWRERIVTQTKETVAFSSLENFIAAPAPEGLGTTVKNLERLCASDLSVLDLLDRSLKGKTHGGDRRSTDFKCHNVTVEKSVIIEKEDLRRGNSAAYGLRRLRNIRPDLHAQVLAKKLSINQAMISAGLRRKSIILTADIDKLCDIIQVNLSSTQIKQLIKKLQK